MFSQKSEFRLKVANLGGKTIIKDMFFTQPFKVMKPFYKPNLTEMYLLNTTAGVFKDDDLSVKICLEDDTNLAILSQSFEKIYDTLDGKAVKNSQIYLGANSRLFYNPLPVILQENSHFIQHTDIFLHSSSKLVYSDILVLGRVGMGEIMAYKNYENKLCIYQNDRLVYRDFLCLEPSSLDGLSVSGGFWHYLSCAVFGYDDRFEEIKERFSYATRLHNGGICIKSLGKTSQELCQMSDEIIKFLY